MKKNIKQIMMLFCLVAILTACKEDEIDVKKSVYNTVKELHGFDKWLDENFRLSYNIQFKYKYEDLETNMNYNLIPAKQEKAEFLAQMIKYLWLDAYTEVTGVDFMRQHAPRMIFLVGSPQWRSSTSAQATAESGLKIVLYDVNEFDHTKISAMNKDYVKTLYHEFSHILHQKKMFDLRFGDWSSTMYIGSSWTTYTDMEAAQGGLVSRYSASEINEDFAEIIAHYVVFDDKWWDEWYILAGEEGTAIIKKKIEFAKEYLMSSWGVDLDKLRSVVRRRAVEAESLILKTEF